MASWLFPLLGASLALAPAAPEPSPPTTATEPALGVEPAAVAAPEQPAPPLAAKYKSKHRVTVSLSAVSAYFAVIQASAEVRVTDRFGAGILGGVGTITLSEDPDPYWPGKVTVQEFGGQLRLYPLGNFDTGLVAGVEVLYLRVSVPDDEGLPYRASISGLGVGPLVGGKLTLGFGATALAQLGVLVMPIKGHGEAMDGTRSVNVKSSMVTPMVDVGVGWSF